VIETRKPLVFNRDVEKQVGLLGQEPGMTSGEQPLSAVWVPLVVGDEVRGIMSLQNIDREDAFSESDVELLTTLAASLSVALENVRLIDETRQRLAELATVNEVGQALSSQLDLNELIELVGEQMRRTFEADICYVALHNTERDEIEFPYFNEFGKPTGQEPFAFGQGLTSRIISQRELLLLNRDRTGTRSGRGAWEPPPNPSSACRSSPAHRASGRSAFRARSGRVASARPTPGFCRRSRPTSGWRSRTPGLPGSPSPGRRDVSPRRGRPGDLRDT
jgi:GAF domain-containing protein